MGAFFGVGLGDKQEDKKPRIAILDKGFVGDKSFSNQCPWKFRFGWVDSLANTQPAASKR